MIGPNTLQWLFHFTETVRARVCVFPVICQVAYCLLSPHRLAAGGSAFAATQCFYCVV